MKSRKEAEKTERKGNTRKLSRLVRALQEGDNFEKDRAMEQLLFSPNTGTVDLVIPLLKDRNTGTRMIALEILKKVGDRNLDSVARLLDDENEDVRVYGCKILGTLRHIDGLPVLIRKIYEDSDNVRNTAAIELGEFDDERSVNALLDALNDDDWIRFSAICSLGKIGGKQATVPLLDLLKNGEEEVSLAACEVLIGFNEEPVLDEVFQILKGWDRKKRDVYMRVILETGDDQIFRRLRARIGKELFEHLLNSIKYENKRSRRMLEHMAHFKNRETCDVILDTLAGMEPDNKDYDAILNIFASLKDIWLPAIGDYLNREDEYSVPVIRACGMANMAIEEALLVKIFRGASAKTRREILKWLPALVDGGVEAILAEALRDTDGHVKGDAVSMIGTMSLTQFRAELLHIARRDFTDVRTKALKVLLKLDRERATRLVTDLVEAGDSEDKKVYLAAASVLDSTTNFVFVRKLLDDRDEVVRRATVGVIGDFLNDEKYVNLLHGLLMREDIPHEVLRVIKEKAVKEFNDRLVDIFLDPGKGLWTRYYALSALGAFEDKLLFDVFIRGLSDESSLIKIVSLKALCDLNDKRAIDHIRPFTSSSDEDIRSTADYALGALERH
jgi:HEAT repeat protein